jgi:hypothetical protein
MPQTDAHRSVVAKRIQIETRQIDADSSSYGFSALGLLRAPRTVLPRLVRYGIDHWLRYCELDREFRRCP